MALSPDFLEELRSRVSIAQVVSRKVKLTRAGRDLKGLCPFHSEKTPSFHVVEDKGFFHCFGCGEHGDAISFLIKAEGLEFREAVETLAAQAGMALPEERPRDTVREAQRADLYSVIEAACRFFEAMLLAPEGRAGLAYLERRGLDRATIKRFRLGYAPDDRHQLGRALTAEGLPEAALIEAGLRKLPEGGGAPFDFFRGRVMFPVTDRRGRVIAFGARALGDAQPKYLNSPETPLFKKSETLYALAAASGPARKTGTVIVAEGYMDVIALHRAGFDYAVAPLGTALTESQLEALWRLAPEPILCFDGDKAGQAAAIRAATRAWPLIGPERSLRFCFMPDGEDPDSLISGQGTAAMRAVLASPKPLADMMWEHLVTGHAQDTPERRAAFRAVVRGTVKAIVDPAVRSEYDAVFAARVGALLGDSPNPQARPGSGSMQEGGSGGNRSVGWGGVGRGGDGRAGAEMWRVMRRLRPVPDDIRRRREERGVIAFREVPDAAARLQRQGVATNTAAVVGTAGIRRQAEEEWLACLLAHPALIEQELERISLVPLQDPVLSRLRDEAIALISADPDLDPEELQRHLKGSDGTATLDSVRSEAVYSRAPFSRPESPINDTREGWLRLTRQLEADRLREDEVADARSLAANADEESWLRFRDKWLRRADDDQDGDAAGETGAGDHG